MMLALKLFDTVAIEVISLLLHWWNNAYFSL